MGLAMARHANTPVPFMCYALMFATKLLNRLHRTMPDGTIDVPLWRFKGVKVPLNLDRFHPFGCAVEAVLPKHSQARFAPKTVSCIFLGFDDNSLSYVLARLPNYGILHTAHAIFNDGDFPCRRLVAANWPMGGAYDEHAEDPLSHWLGDGRHLALVDVRESEFQVGGEHLPTSEPTSLGSTPPPIRSGVNAGIPNSASVSVPSRQPPVSQEDHHNLARARRSSRGWQPSAAALENIASNVVEFDALFAVTESEPEYSLASEAGVSDWLFAVTERRVPRSYEQILSLPQIEKDKWLAACKEESNSHLSIPSISGVLHPSKFTAAAPIRLSWVFTIKPTGEYKARIVMVGQHMREGVHYAPVPSPTLIRLFFALIAVDARDFTQLDIKTAFLTAPIDIELDVILPNGFGRGEECDHLTPDSRRRRALTAIRGARKGQECGARSFSATYPALDSSYRVQLSHAS